VDEREESNDDTPTGAALLVASPDVEEEDRRARRSLIVACLLALLVAATAGLMNSNRATGTTTGGDGDTPASGASDEGAPSAEACPVSPEVAAALSTAETPWDYMLILGYPKYAIGDVLNERAEAVMQEADGQVKWDPASSNGRYSDEAQLVLIVETNGDTVEITDTQAVMWVLGMEAFCPFNSEVVLPVLS
jgi:hypothetical protein